MNSSTPHTTTHHPKDEHGSITSYVIGFVLSLVFTVIPYYLIVDKPLTGTTLVVTLLGFGVIQMIIQIFFFLHLGRGPKPLYNVIFFVATVSLILVVVFGSIFIMDHLHYNMSPTEVTKNLAQKEGLDQVGGEKTGACQEIGFDHKVVIKDGKATPNYVAARLCDTLTFVNEDGDARKLTFGAHPNDSSYAGEAEITVRKGRNKSFALNQSGEYAFHDHLESKTTGIFNVVEQ